jgi:all-trans-retinol 13,14-reductase
VSNYFDILIIGSGLGGLITANILSRKGYKVAVLEKNDHPGGCLQSFEKDGVIFDTGIHYVGGLEKNQALNKVFSYLGILPELSVRKMDEEGFDRFQIGNNAYAYSMGYENFEKKLFSYFPAEKKAIRNYVNKIREIANSISLYNLRPVNMDPKLFYEKFNFGNTWDYIRSITPVRELQQLLAALNSLYAGTPESSFLYVHALILNHYIESAWRFVDGSKQVADQLVMKLKENGGELYLDEKAVRFKGQKGKIELVITASGQEYYSNNYISAIHPYETMEMLEDGIVRKAYRNRLQNIANTISTFSLYLVFHDKKVPYLNSNFYYYPSGNVWGLSDYSKQVFPQNLGFYPIADSADEQYTRGASVLSFMDYDEVAPWEGSTIEKRGQSYEDFKQEKAEKMIELLEGAMPGIKHHIKSYTAATPLTLRDYTGTHRGSTYGIFRDFRSPNESLLFPHTKVKNLFLSGQNLSLHGMLGTTMGALLTCSEFYNLNDLLKEINNA